MEKQIPDLYVLSHKYSNDAQYILDRDTGKYILINPSFSRLLGYSEAELLSGKIKPVDMVTKEYRDRLELLDDPNSKLDFDRFELRIVQHSGRYRDVEVTINNVDIEGKKFRIGSVRDITKRKRLQQQLEHQIKLQKQKTMEAAKATIRIYQLTEKIKNTPNLATHLMRSDTEEVLLKQATLFLTDSVGLNYKEVIFFIKEGDYLVPKSFLVKKMRKKKISIYDNSKISAVFRGDKDGISGKNEEILPLRGRDQTVGVVQIKYSEEERALFGGNKIVKTEQRNILRTLTNIIALAIVNLRLFKTVEQQSIIDELTGAYNRRFFESKLQEEMDRAGRYNRNLSIIYLDLDNLKEINDSYGHDQGDLVLKEIARIIKASSRKIDFTCRWGGDEFAIILPETSIEEAISKAETLRTIVEKHPFTRLDDRETYLTTTLSLGVSEFHKGDSSVPDLFKRADDALYQAKQKGRNKVEVRTE
ncbi:MAG: diguanylate cyclase [Planctomycetota bacterium]